MPAVTGQDENGVPRALLTETDGTIVGAGSEQGDSKYNSRTRTTDGWRWATSSSGTGDFTVWNGPCRIGKVISDTAIDVVAKDGSTSLTTALAVGAKGATDGLMHTECRTSGVINRSAAAIISVQYQYAKFED